jgi:hypothetical protein
MSGPPVTRRAHDISDLTFARLFSCVFVLTRDFFSHGASSPVSSVVERCGIVRY